MVAFAAFASEKKPGEDGYILIPSETVVTVETDGAMTESGRLGGF